MASPNVPTIAVVITNYNYERFVGDAIRSALAQTVPFDQVIVVDDGSKDNSLATIRGFEPDVSVVAQTNSGPMRASMAGIEKAHTDYLYILDADDYVSPDFVETLRPHLAGSPAKVQFQVAGVSAEGAPLGSVFPLFPKDYASSQARADNVAMGFYISPPTSGNVYRRSFLAGLDLASLPPRDFVDGVPNLVAPYFGDIASIDRPLAFYRVHGNSDSQWGKPSIPLLEREIAWLGERWDAALRLAPAAGPMPDLETTVYVAERRLMLAALGNAPVAGPVRRYLAALNRSGAPLATRVGLSGWAAAFLLPLTGVRKRLVLARRSPQARPAFVNAAVLGLKRAVATPRRLLARGGN